MKILMLTPYLPYPLLSGGQIRTYNLLKKLSDKHQVTLFALIKDESERRYIDELKKYCSKVVLFKRSTKPFTIRNIIKTAFSSYPFLVVRNHVPEMIRAVEAELLSSNYDLIHSETFYMMPHIRATKVPLLLVEQTIEYLGYESYARSKKFWLQRLLLQIDIFKIKYWEKHYWQSCTKLVTMSEEDKQFIVNEVGNGDKIHVVSNGVDVAWFAAKKRALPKDPTILSVGTFHWLPNVEAVQYLVQEVWPLVKLAEPKTKLWIVGNAPTKEILKYEQQDKQIKVTGGIPDIRDAFVQAHVLVAPVFSGKGTRYKILEAMASGTPIVATPLAVEGLGVQHNQHVMIGTTPQEMAQLTVDVLRNSELQSRLAKNGLQFVKQHYDWSGISRELDSVYQKLGA